MTKAEIVAKKLRKVADTPNAERLLVQLPSNNVRLPEGEFILGPFLRFIAAALEGKV